MSRCSEAHNAAWKKASSERRSCRSHRRLRPARIRRPKSAAAVANYFPLFESQAQRERKPESVYESICELCAAAFRAQRERLASLVVAEAAISSAADGSAGRPLPLGACCLLAFGLALPELLAC